MPSMHDGYRSVQAIAVSLSTLCIQYMRSAVDWSVEGGAWFRGGGGISKHEASALAESRSSPRADAVKGKGLPH